MIFDIIIIASCIAGLIGSIYTHKVEWWQFALAMIIIIVSRLQLLGVFN